MDILKIFRLFSEGKSQRSISKLLNIHRKVVNQYIGRVKILGLKIDEVLLFDDKQLNDIFPANKSKKNECLDKLESYFEQHQKDQKFTGFTVQNHWQQYASEVPNGLCRSQFFAHFKRIFKAPKGSFKIEHCFGEKLFIDYAGKHLSIIDKDSGEIKKVEVFIGILPASQYIFVQATLSQCLSDFITCTANCLAFIGGVPQSITTDNLKSAVTKASKTEPVINKSFKDFANHYNTVVTPTRAYSPKDKAMVEGAVRIVYCSVYYALRHQHFFSLQALNKAIEEQIAKLNNRPLSNKQVSRADQFKQEQATLKPLPIHGFNIWEYKKATVQKMGYVFVSKYKNYYSIPYRYIGKQIQVRTNNRCIEAYYNGDQIASHLLAYTPSTYTTIKEHLHSHNQFYLDWSPNFFIEKAKCLGEDVSLYVSAMIAQSAYPETAYKSALAILDLKRLYPIARIAKACALALDYEKLNCGMIRTILENKRDELITTPELTTSTTNVQHENIRGSQYYSN